MGTNTPPEPASSPPPGAGLTGGEQHPVRRRLLLAAAGGLGLAVTTVWVWRSVTAIRHRSEGTPPPCELDTALVVEHLAVLFVALLAWGCLVAADGRRAAGAPHRPWLAHVRLLGSYLAGPFLVLVFFIGLAHLLVAESTGSVVDATMAQGWARVLASATTGVAEELVLLGLLYRFLEYLPGRGGQRLAATAAGTAVLIVVRLCCHGQTGAVLELLALLPWAWLTVRLYRTTRTLTPIIIGHLAYGIATDFVFGPATFLLLLITVPAFFNVAAPFQVAYDLGFARPIPTTATATRAPSGRPSTHTRWLRIRPPNDHADKPHPPDGRQ